MVKYFRRPQTDETTIASLVSTYNFCNQQTNFYPAPVDLVKILLKGNYRKSSTWLNTSYNIATLLFLLFSLVNF